MALRWPLALIALLAVPLLLALYLWGLRRRRRTAVSFPNIGLIRAALPKRSAWKRHIPVALFLAALVAIGVSVARPQASTLVPTSRTTAILALDVSRSMCSTDVDPNRLSAAQEAAKKFVEDQPKGMRLGLVAFAGFAQVVVEPTTEKAELLKAIDAFTTGRGTAIGAALLKSIDALSTINSAIAPVDPTEELDQTTFDPNNGTFAEETVAPEAAAHMSKKEHVADVVVLLTDGANTVGVTPLAAAEQAATRGVRVYTIGFGTESPEAMQCTAAQLGGDIFGEGLGGAPPPGTFLGRGRTGFLLVDEPTLRQVAELTGGQYYKAEDASQLKKVFAELPAQVELTRRKVELTAAFAAFGAFLAATAMALSLWWNRTP